MSLGRLWLIRILALGLLAGPMVPARAADLAGKQVLVLTSYGDGRPGVEALLNGFSAGLQEGGLTINDLFIENLDLERAKDPAFRRSLVDTLRLKYRERRIDLLYIVEQPALDYLLSELEGLAPGAPAIVVRAGLTGLVQHSSRRFISQLVSYDLAGTLHAAQALFPRTRRVLFIAGSTESDRAVAAQAAAEMNSWSGPVIHEDTCGLSLEQIQARVANPAPGSLILVLPVNRDGAGHTAVQMETGFRIAASARAPVFTLWDNLVGQGAVGGCVTNFWATGHQAGRFATDLLTGRTATTGTTLTLPSVSTAKFDWAQIQRWQGEPERLPEASVFINRPASLWVQFRRTVILWGLVLGGQSILIVLLLVQRRRHRQARAALLASEERFRQLMEQAPEAIIVYDPALGRVVDVNANAERLFGRSRAELQAMGFTNFYAPEQPDGRPVAESFAEYTAQVQREGAAVLERVIRGPGGRLLTCELRLSYLPSANHRLIRGSYIDITERKRVEAQIRGMNDELELQVRERTASLEASTREMEAFSYSVSHDLRAPLRAIDGFSRVLLDDYGDRLDAEGQRYLGRVRAGAQHMGQLIEDLLKLSHIARVDLERQPVDLGAQARRILEGLSQGYPQRRVQTVIPSRLTSMGDPRLLSIALDNLLGNAWKYTQMKPEAKIELGFEVLEGEPTYFVRDNGAGFDMRYADKLFGAFQRLHSGSDYEGTGIGLAIVQRIIHRHGGRIWAEAEPGKGATFFFTLA